ncbi:MAG: hypothetical protein IT456_26135 [Planctomycetes bacterium]|nr:hypothetical protein [Planctomycetota bacterium]
MTKAKRKKSVPQPGRVYRTRELAPWGANTPRLAKRLVGQGRLVALAHGLFSCPRRSKFGPVPPDDRELMRAFLSGAPFVFTGPEAWNTLGLGTTAVFAVPLVYNTKRSGLFEFGGRKLLLRRVAFPAQPSPEWFVVDLFEHAGQAAASLQELTQALSHRVSAGAFDASKLRKMAARYGSLATRLAIASALGEDLS